MHSPFVKQYGRHAVYLELIDTGKIFGTVDVVIGPFSSEEELNDFRKEWKKIFRGPKAITRVLKKKPKSKIYPVSYGRFALNICKMFKKNN